MKKLIAVIMILPLLLCLTACGEAKEIAGNCSLSISCETVLANEKVMKDLPDAKKQILPESGIIAAVSEIAFYDGETVMDLLQRYFKEKRLHIDISEGSFVQGMGNIYNGDGGELSGWFFFINGESAAQGANEYKISDGDVIEFKYTCDMGADLGLTWE